MKETLETLKPNPGKSSEEGRFGFSPLLPLLCDPSHVPWPLTFSSFPHLMWIIAYILPVSQGCYEDNKKYCKALLKQEELDD